MIIECSVCNRQVENLAMYEDPMTDRIVYEVRCHGEVLKFTMDRKDFVSADKIEITKAFFDEPKRLIK